MEDGTTKAGCLETNIQTCNQRQDNCKFKSSLGYRTIPCLSQGKKKDHYTENQENLKLNEKIVNRCQDQNESNGVGVMVWI
jgi:hypothetical protein